MDDKPSDWLSDTDYIEKNSAWLKYSQMIALKVLGHLREKNMSQNDLADLMHVSRQQVNKWLKGRENFTLETITKLADAVEIPFEDLIQPFEEKIIALAKNDS
nr:helix-turn-helix transcriptional regulator [uncultured Dyadobacter sp.]